MESLRLQNYRCFEDTGEVGLRILNLLVGSNSSGKSSFLEAFALLRQSVETEHVGALLWNGALVDYKSFVNTLRRGGGAPEMIMEFQLRPGTLRKYFASPRDVRLRISIAEDALPRTAESAELPLEATRRDYVAALDISLLNGSENVVLSARRQAGGAVVLSLNGQEISLPGYRVSFRANTLGLLPGLSLEALNEESARLVYDPELYVSVGREVYHLFKDNLPSDPTVSELNGLDPIPLDKSQVRTLFPFAGGVPAGELHTPKDNFATLYKFGLILEALNKDLCAELERIVYVKPLRLAPKRYYEFSNLSVELVDSRGDNLGEFFVNLLRQGELPEYNEWCLCYFDFKVEVEAQTGRIELFVQRRQEQEKYNLVDVGMGYSQILPLLANIWKIKHDLKKSPAEDPALFRGTQLTHFIIVEQPELHLHPRMVGSFSNMLISLTCAIKQERLPIKILIETHSAVLVNNVALAAADSESELVGDDFSILIFNGKAEGLRHEVETAQMKDGRLVNWPMGFFSDRVY